MKCVVGMAVWACSDASSAIGPGGGPEMVTLLRIDLPPVHPVHVYTGTIGDGSSGSDMGTFLTVVTELEGGFVGCFIAQ